MQLWDISAARKGNSPAFDIIRECVYLLSTPTGYARPEELTCALNTAAVGAGDAAAAALGLQQVQGSVATDLLKETINLPLEHRARSVYDPANPKKKVKVASNANVSADV